MSGTEPGAEAADVGLLSPATAGSAAESLTGDAAVLSALVRAEAALLRAQASVGLLPASATVLADRVEAARPGLDPRVLALAARGGGNPVIPLVAALREAVGGERPEATGRTGDQTGWQAGWIHRGATSQDVLDTALVLVAEAVLHRIEGDLTQLAGSLADLAGHHRDTPMVARTLTQQALPSTLGLRLAGWLAGVHDALEVVRACRPLPASLSGPVGSASAFAPQGPAVLSAYADELGLATPVLGWHTRRHPVLALGAALGEVGGACGKIAADVLVMAQSEVGEAREAAGGSSSSMSHKSNPVLSVLVASATRQLAPLGSILVAAASAEQERPAGAWHAEWQPLRSMLRLAGAAAEHTARLVAGVAFDEAALRRNLDHLVEALDEDERWVAAHTQAAGPWVDRVLAASGGDRVSSSADETGGATAVVELKHYEQGPPDAPAVLLAPSLGTTLAMWDHLAESLAASYRVIRFDTRGHGASPAPAGPYTVAELAADVIALADLLEIERFAVVGLSLGGAIAQQLALEHPSRVTALVLACTGPSFGDPQNWRDRAARVRAEGMRWLVEPTEQRWFTTDFVREHRAEADRLLEMIATTSPEGYAACCDALAAYDVTTRLPEIGAPTRVVAGRHDRVSPPEVARGMVESLPDADLVVLEEASHIANVAQPEAFDRAVREHLDRTVGPPADHRPTRGES